MVEKRWLLHLGPPVLVVGMLGAAAVSALTAAPVRLAASPLVRQLSPAAELRRLAPDVADRVWIAERGDGVSTYGQAGRGTVRSLPARETAIAAGARYVASTASLDNGRSRVILHESQTGSVVAEIVAPIWVSAGAYRGDELIVTGYSDDRAVSDGGLLMIRPNGDTETFVPPGPFPARLGKAARGTVFVSPNGRLAASYVCHDSSCETQVVDLASKEVFRPTTGQPGFLRALTDTAVILTDDEYQWIVAADARTGGERWRLTDSILMTPLAGADGSVTALVGSEQTGWAVARIDEHGRSKDLTPRTSNGTWPEVWTQVSTPQVAVVGLGDFAAALSDPSGATADLVDIGEARALGRDVVVLPANEVLR